MIRGAAPAKINLALVVGPHRADGRHEVATVLQRVDLVDRVSISDAAALRISGFPGDTLVRAALETLAERAQVEPRWQVRLTKRIPIAAGLGGGSSDAGTALRLANALLPEPLAASDLEHLAAELGADVPFFLREGPQLGTGDGSEVEPLELPQDFWVVLVLPRGITKRSTAAV
jgi:4-diphosphocytidyl-2-C-methyl-D-erythritol kinase